MAARNKIVQGEIMAKKALMVGINDYKSINDLSGCINDVTNMRNILTTYLGFTNKDVPPRRTS